MKMIMTIGGFKKAVKLLGALIGLVLIVLWTSGVLRDRQAPGKVDVETFKPIPSDATVLTVRRENVPSLVTLGGTVCSVRRINLSARLSAYVEAVHVSAGSRVEQGDLLVELDQRELRQELAAADAQLAQAETAYRRSERLLETQATTEQAHDLAVMAFRSAAANVDRLNVVLSYTRITAPLSGVVANRHVEPGDLASPGQKLLSVYDPSHLRLEVPVPARWITYFPEGREVVVMLDQVDMPVGGRVTEIVSEFDPVSRTRLVKIRLEDSEEDVLPGMYGYVLVEATPREGIFIPDHAVLRIGQLESVMVATEQGMMRRLIRLGIRHRNRIEILSGLEDGESIVVPAPPKLDAQNRRTDILNVLGIARH